MSGMLSDFRILSRCALQVLTLQWLQWAQTFALGLPQLAAASLGG
jgi:hypothetical protein